MQAAPVGVPPSPLVCCMSRSPICDLNRRGLSLDRAADSCPHITTAFLFNLKFVMPADYQRLIPAKCARNAAPPFRHSNFAGDVAGRGLQRTKARDMWYEISRAPFDVDLELAVIDADGVHAATVFPCQRVSGGWVKARTMRPVDVHPTHWRESATDS